jgi:hypothetical protein
MTGLLDLDARRGGMARPVGDELKAGEAIIA